MDAEKALASETRKEIMVLLAGKNHRPSDLSRELGKDKSTIVEHLELLREAGLVERIEREGHKWIFYGLSKNGEAYFPNRKKRIIYLALAMLSFIGAIISGFMQIQSQQPQIQESAEALMAAKAVAADEQAGANAYGYVTVIAALLFLLSITMFARTKENKLVLKTEK